MTNDNDHIKELHAQITQGIEDPYLYGELHELVAEKIADSPCWREEDSFLRSVAFECLKRESENTVPGVCGTPVMDAFLELQAETGA